MSSGARIIYVTYDGLAEPLGQSQVLPYLRGLARLGHRIDVVSFEKAPMSIGVRELDGGLGNIALRYHKEPTVPATAFDILAGAAVVTRIAATRGVDLLHARSYVAGCVAAMAGELLGRPFLLDTRGNWVDEKVESGSWVRGGRLERSARVAEKWLFSRSSGVTVLTNAYRDHLRQSYPHPFAAPIRVIPTCVDLDTFRPSVEPDPSLAQQTAGRHVLAYVGTLGGFYRDREMARFYLAYRKYVGAPTAFLVLSRESPNAIRAELVSAGVGDELFHRTATREEMPRALRVAKAMVALDTRGPAGLGAAPTKLGEALALGIPVAITPSGDVPHVAQDSPATILVPSLTAADLENAAARLFRATQSQTVAHSARRTAESWFSLESGIRAYDAFYRQLCDGSARGDRPWPPE